MNLQIRKYFDAHQHLDPLSRINMGFVPFKNTYGKGLNQAFEEMAL
jgi:hypothetical protein